ncbi:hypothetical protein FNF29_06701 [Cafeteria roenbergensis]|uniref:C3H1-type domain-containing protein n=1 Tax=Cafeteria roenbergensis TaxID=33653 RepID=A0A5A8C6Y5_CAFRO|nr:hypothetical protein FNF29_06701 [Cafeteria roenbergensis]|eukprot:KAA0148484.1 hypothetical protein FNF29_06701 [Cafeteria roenbergensis]
MDSRRSTERYKSKICLFWLQPEGCRYGSDCWFAHGPDEIRTTANSNTPGNSPATNLRYKVRICRHWSESGGDWCPHGVRCTYAHGEDELRTPNDNVALAGRERGSTDDDATDEASGAGGSPPGEARAIDDSAPTQSHSWDRRGGHRDGGGGALSTSTAGPRRAHRGPTPVSVGQPASSPPAPAHAKLGPIDEAEVRVLVAAAARWMAASSGGGTPSGGEPPADGAPAGPAKPSDDPGKPSGDGRAAGQAMADSKDDAGTSAPPSSADEAGKAAEGASEADVASLRRLAASPASDPAAVSRAQMHIRYLAAQDQASFLDQVRSLAGKEDYKAAIAALALGHTVQPAAGSAPASRSPDSAMPGGGLQAGVPGKHPLGPPRPDWGGPPRDSARRPAPLSVHGDGPSRGPGGPGTPPSFGGHGQYSPVVSGAGRHPPSRPYPGGAGRGAPSFPGMRHAAGTPPRHFAPAFFDGRQMYFQPPPGTPPAQAMPAGGFGYHEAAGHGPRGPPRFGTLPPQQQWSDPATGYAPHPASPGSAAARGHYRMSGGPPGAGPGAAGPEFHFADGGVPSAREAAPHGHPLHGDVRKGYGAPPPQDARRPRETPSAHHAPDEGGVAAAAVAMASLQLDDEPSSSPDHPATSAALPAASHAGQGLSTDSPAFSMDSWPSLAHDAATAPSDAAGSQPRLELGFGGGALSSGLGNYGATSLDGSGSLGLWHASALPSFGLSQDGPAHEVGGAEDLM